MESAVLLFLSVGTTLAGTPWDFTVSNNRFAASVYKAHSLKSEGNFLLSPLSLDTVLTLVHWGAKGETANQLSKSLFLPENKDEVEFTLKHHLETLGLDQPYIFRTINKIYVKDDYLLNDGFKNASKDVFGCELEGVDFSEKVEAASKMNKWVAEKTDQKIQQLVDSETLNNETRALLLNTVFLKGKWSNPFTKLYTSKEDFDALTDKGVQVDMMHAFGATYNYYESVDLDAKFLDIPFEGDNISMTVVLPNAKDGLYKLEQEIHRVLETNNFTVETVDLSLPRFRIESRVDCKEILKMLGISTAFEEGVADFSGIAGNPGDLFVNEVVQKSFIDVDESGVEAASATSIIVLFNRNGIPAKEFTVNHPFLFYVKVNDLIVFIGRVLTPSSNQLK